MKASTAIQSKNRSRKSNFRFHFSALILLIIVFLSLHFLPDLEFCLNKKYFAERNQLEKLNQKVFSNVLKRINRFQEISSDGKNEAIDEIKNNALILPIPFSHNRSKKAFDSAFSEMDRFIEKIKSNIQEKLQNSNSLNNQLQNFIAEKKKLEMEKDERESREKFLSNQINQLETEKQNLNLENLENIQKIHLEKNKTRNLIAENKKLKKEISNLDTKITKLTEIDIQLLKNYKMDSKLKSNYKNVQNFVGNYIFRGEYKYLKNLCNFSPKQIEDMIDSPHECIPKERNIYVNNKWRKAMYLGIYMRSKRQIKSNSTCLIACFDSNNGCPHKRCLVPIHIRPNTSDPHVAKQMMETRELSMIYRKFKFKTILDAGGNIGLASLFLAVMFPKAKIVTIEPSQTNFAMLKLNTNQFPNVFPLKAALWPRVTKLALAKGDDLLGEEWGFRVYELDEVPSDLKIEDSLQGVSVDFLLNVFDLPNFDFVKMDIEGSEQEVFNTSLSKPNELDWVRNSKMIIIEWHDHMKKGSSKSTRQFFKSLEPLWFRKRNMGYEIFKNAEWSQQLQ